MVKLFTTIYESILKLFQLYRKNKTVFILSALIFFSLSIYHCREEIADLLYPQKDILAEYLNKTITIEQDCKEVVQNFNASSAAVFIIHNGEVSVSNLHLMKGTIIADYSERIANNYYTTFPLYPYSRYISQSIKEGYFYVQDLSTSEDVLLRTIHSNTGVKSIIYIPIKKQNQLVGFLVINFYEVRVLSRSEIEDMIRFVDLIESHVM